jgi:hypothetical protein
MRCRSPKKLQYSDAPKVTITPTTPETERCIENELPVIPTLERRTKSWSGMLNSKEERVKSAGQLSPRKESAGDLFIVKAPITPKKERSGFRVPFRRRNTHDMEKGKRPLHPMPSPLIRSISACDLPSSPMAQNDIGQKDDVRMRRRSSDQKVVRFTENTRPTMEVDERWAGSDGNVSKTPAPSHICSSPESITPSSIPRGRHFVAAWEDGESSDADTLVNDFNGVIQETTEWRDTTPGKGACGDRIDLNDLWLQTPYKAEGGCELLPPSPVSPPDPEYIERIESEMEQIFANTHLFEDEPEEKELDISEMTEEQAYANYVGKVSQWLQFPPKQVSSEYMPKSKAHWDWRALELRGRDPFTVFSGPGLNLDDGSGIKFPATF